MKDLSLLGWAEGRVIRWIIAGASAAIVVGLVVNYSLRRPQAQAEESVHAAAPLAVDEPIQPIVPVANLDPRKVALGQKLFQDSRLSHNGRISCASCHDVATGGGDHRVHSAGINEAEGIINAPTVLNSGLNFSQFWDGRAATLEAQIDDPVQSKIEMGSTWPEVIEKLNAVTNYRESFNEIYHADAKPSDVKDAIAEFERSLTTPNSRFDRYLRFDKSALTTQEVQGYLLFKSLGCASCHQGANVGGNMYQKLGVMAPYFDDRGHITKADKGRFNVTGNPQDMYMFKVPSLRNVELTAPYFHDGSATTLPDAVRLMGKYQLGRALTDEEIALLVAFLKTLTGELNGKPF